MRPWAGKTTRETFDNCYFIDEHGCWIWKTIKDPARYPTMFREFKGKKIRCSWFAWERKHGKHVPEGMQMLHTCDRPNCVNPDHLFLGTQPQNIADMIDKKRHAGPRGLRNSHAKLTEDQVRSIRYLFDDGHSAKKLSPIFGVTPTNILAIGRRQTWRDVI